MPRLVLKFEKYLDPDRVFEILRERAQDLSGFIARSGSSGSYDFMGNSLSIEVDPHGVVFSFLESGVDPLLRPLESFAKGISEDYGKPRVGLDLPLERKGVWTERFRNLF